jgi:hypothetical protein
MLIFALLRLKYGIHDQLRGVGGLVSASRISSAGSQRFSESVSVPVTLAMTQVAVFRPSSITLYGKEIFSFCEASRDGAIDL